MECSEEAWVIKITLISSSDSTKSLLDEPVTPIIRDLWVIKVIFSIWLIPFTGWPLEIEVFEIYVPLLVRVFLI
jgi:hypothetical protein